MRTLNVYGILVVCSLIIGCGSKLNEADVIEATNPLLVQSGKYLLFDNRPLNAVIVEHFPNGRMARSSTFKNGLQHGMTRTWYSDGNLESERSYKRGEKDGLHTGWWQNGHKQYEYHFTNGAYEGSFKEWYANGRPLHAFEYSGGREVSAVGWRENGKTYINFVMRNGRKYGLTNARLCYSLKDETGVFREVMSSE